MPDSLHDTLVAPQLSPPERAAETAATESGSGLPETPIRPQATVSQESQLPGVKDSGAGSSQGAPVASLFPFPKQSGIGNLVPLRVWEMPEPGPRKWVVAGLVPEGVITILYGDGGTCKSYLGLYLAIQALRGEDFLGKRVTQQPSVLYIDAELDDEEFRRRAYPVSRGVGLEKIPKGLHYLALTGSLADGDVHEAVRAAVKSCEATLVVVDSLTVAAFGSDLKEADVVTALMRELKELGPTTLAVDHIAKPQPGTNVSAYRPFGSVFKYNLARSLIHVIGAKGGGFSLQQTKSNFGGFAESVGIAVEFADGGKTVAFHMLQMDDERLAGIEDQLPALEKVAHALAQYGPAKPEDIGTPLEMLPKTVQNYLSTLRRQNRAEPLGDGRWRVPDPGVLRVRNREAEEQDAKELLGELLATGRVEQSVVMDRAREHDVSIETITRIRKAMGVSIHLEGFRNVWELQQSGTNQGTKEASALEQDSHIGDEAENDERQSTSSGCSTADHAEGHGPECTDV